MDLTRIDSEIALTAFLSTAVAGYPMPTLSLYPYVKATALGLLVLTLARRVGVMNGLTNRDAVIRATTYMMDPATYISVLYLSYALMEWTTRLIDIQIPNALLFGGSTGGLIFAVFVISELVLGASLREGERVFSASASRHQGEAFGALLDRIAQFAGRARQDSTGQQVKLTHPRFYDRTFEDYTDEEVAWMVRSVTIMVVSILIPLLGYAGLGVVGKFLFDLSWPSAVLLLMAVMFVSAFVRLWFSNYGLVQVEDRNGYLTFFGDITAFLVTGLMVV